MTRLGDSWLSFTAGLMPPIQAVSHFEESQTRQGTLSQWVITGARSFGFPYPHAIARAAHIAIGAAQCALFVYALFSAKRVSWIKDVGALSISYLVFYIFADYYASGINTCRTAHAYMCGEIAYPQGLQKGSARGNGDCFYDSFLQLVQPENSSEKVPDDTIQELRKKIADEVLNWYDRVEHQNEETLIHTLAAKYNVPANGVTRVHAETFANKIRISGPKGGEWADNIEIAALVRLAEYADYKIRVYQASFKDMNGSDFFKTPTAPVGWTVSEPRTFPETEEAIARNTTISLWNWDNVHYEPLKPTGNG